MKLVFGVVCVCLLNHDESNAYYQELSTKSENRWFKG